MKHRNRLVSVLLLFLCITLLVLWRPWEHQPGEQAPAPSPEATQPTLPDSLHDNRQVAQKYCSTCHTYPEPGLLDKDTWLHETLPNMGPRFGIFAHNGVAYPTENTPNLPANLYPDRQTITDRQWQMILDFYGQAAPDTLTQRAKKDITIDELFFRARRPNYRGQTPPLVTAVRFDPVNRLIYFADAAENKFHIFDDDLDLEARFTLSSPVSDIQLMNELRRPGRRDLLTTYIGDLNPSDALNGFIQPVWYNPTNGSGGAGQVIMDSLARPVESLMADLNSDGTSDLLVNQFGHRTGSLFWLQGTGPGSFAPDRRVLINTPGCIESHVTDFTGNGRDDVIALCSQLDQAIYLFENRGDGQFDRQKLVQFEIVAGSSSFKLHDFNDDGLLDILYTSGDNADYSIIYKPYHGVYIYLNQGNQTFEQAWFYPINGAYDAVPRDFDQDGDTDLATIAFFADYDNYPREGFVYFQNEGGMEFKPYHHPAASGGRWIAMDVADWTGNGYDDIVLANFSLGPTRVKSLIQKKFTEGPHIIVLENRGDR